MATQRSKNYRTIASKLHRQFSHPTPKKLFNLIQKSNFKKLKNKNFENEIKNVSENCITCVKFKKPSPRPVVCMPMASEFNETVAMDLKVWGKHYFLVIVDLATRFCTASVISNKVPATIIKSLFVSWITIFGAPKKIFSDNGGEFNNDEMRALGEAFNIKIITTAAESPWSNGICERLNGVLGDLVIKVLDDAKCDLQIALAWAVAARNAYDNNSGFSPNQLVFGFNPAIPNIYHNKLPGLENVTMSEIVRRNLNAVHIARQEFVKFESSDRIKRALNHNIRETHTDNLNIGDNVYFKRNDSKEWRGPGKIVDIEGKTVLVKHGGAYLKVHFVSLTKIADDTNDTEYPPILSDENEFRICSENRPMASSMSRGNAGRGGPEDSAERTRGPEKNTMASSMSRGNAGRWCPDDSAERTRGPEKSTMASSMSRGNAGRWCPDDNAQAGTSEYSEERNKRGRCYEDNISRKKSKNTRCLE